MTIRERWARLMSTFWGGALFMGAFWSAWMIGLEYVIPPADGPTAISVVVTLIGGAVFGVVMAFWFKRYREKAAERSAGDKG